MAKMTFGVRLRQARREAGMTQKQLGSKAGIEQGTISDLENDKYSGSAYTPQLAAALGVNALWLANEKGAKHVSSGGDGPNNAPDASEIGKLSRNLSSSLGHSNTAGPDIKGKYPLISWAQAAAWETIVDNFAPGDAEEWLDAPVSVSQSSYYLRVPGQSMYDPADHRSFHEGELALVDTNAEPQNGSLVIVVLPGDTEATLRQLIVEGSRRYLKALNPNWPNRISELGDDASVLGVVKGKFVGGY